MPRPSAAKTASACGGRQRQRAAERGAHERRGAGRGDRHGEHAGQRVVDQRMARAARRPASPAARPPNSNTPARFRPISVNSSGQRRDERRRLQLEAPAELLAAGAQRQQQAGQRDEGQHHAGGVGEPAGEQRAAVAGRAARSRAPSATAPGTRRASGSAAGRRAAPGRSAAPGTSGGRGAAPARCRRLTASAARPVRRGSPASAPATSNRTARRPAPVVDQHRRA